MTTTGARLRTVAQAAEEYPWATERWLRRQIYENHLGSYRVSGRVLVDLDELDALVQAGRREPRHHT